MHHVCICSMSRNHCRRRSDVRQNHVRPWDVVQASVLDPCQTLTGFRLSQRLHGSLLLASIVCAKVIHGPKTDGDKNGLRGCSGGKPRFTEPHADSRRLEIHHNVACVITPSSRNLLCSFCCLHSGRSDLFNSTSSTFSIHPRLLSPSVTS